MPAAKPVMIYEAQGKANHRSKKEMSNRKDSVIKFGGQYIKCPEYIKIDLNAYAKWQEIAELYFGVDFIGAGDSGMIARYCITHSEYMDLISRRGRIDALTKDNEDVEEVLPESDDIFSFKVRRKIMDAISTQAILNLDTSINKKMDMLIKMEDRMFLNPLAKLKNVPKKEETKPVDKMQAAGFDL
jgi:phage terminase small subunit